MTKMDEMIGLGEKIRALGERLASFEARVGGTKPTVDDLIEFSKIKQEAIDMRGEFKKLTGKDLPI